MPEPPKIAVYVATTEGPVRIERITRERAPRSAVCLGRTTKVLPVSDAYDAFVRRPSGVIERELGPYPPGAFRLDVSADITNGESWQLGVFLAHALAAAGLLADPDDRPARAIMATGRVLNDLVVAPVEMAGEKARAGAKEAARLAAAGVPVTILAHPDNVGGIEAAGLPDEIGIAPVATTEEAFRTLGVPDRPATPRLDAGEWLGRHPRTLAAGVAAAVLALLASWSAGWFGLWDRAPVANAGGPYTVGAGGSVVVSAAARKWYPGEPQTLYYAWDLDGDGSFESPGRQVRFDASAIAAGPGTRTIGVRISDATHRFAVAHATVRIDKGVPKTSDEPAFSVPRSSRGFLSAAMLSAMFSGAIAYMASPIRGYDMQVMYHRGGSFYATLYPLRSERFYIYGKWWTEDPGTLCVRPEWGFKTRKVVRTDQCTRFKLRDDRLERYKADGTRIAKRFLLTHEAHGFLLRTAEWASPVGAADRTAGPLGRGAGSSATGWSGPARSTR